MFDASIIIVNYHTETHVLELLSWLVAADSAQSVQLIVVDNSPGRGLARRCHALCFAVEYISCGHNVGFGGGVNVGIARATAPVLILLNPDTRPGPGCLEGLVDFLSANPTVAVAGPCLMPLDPEKAPVPSATRREPDMVTVLIEYTALRRLVRPDWLATRYFLDPQAGAGAISCAMVQGACFALHRRWLPDGPAFDAERFFLYWEETDFCRRMRQRGAQIAYLPYLRCGHAGGASIADGEQDIFHFWRSFYRYQGKYNCLPYQLVMRISLALGMMAEYALSGLLRLHRGGRDPRLKRNMHRLWRQVCEQVRWA